MIPSNSTNELHSLEKGISQLSLNKSKTPSSRNAALVRHHSGSSHQKSNNPVIALTTSSKSSIEQPSTKSAISFTSLPDSNFIYLIKFIPAAEGFRFLATNRKFSKLDKVSILKRNTHLIPYLMEKIKQNRNPLPAVWVKALQDSDIQIPTLPLQISQPIQKLQPKIAECIARESIRVEKAIQSVPRYRDIALGVSGTYINDIALRLNLCKEDAARYQLRIQLNDTFYHFWGDTHTVLMLQHAFRSSFEKYEPHPLIKHFMEATPRSSEKVQPIEPDQRLFLVGKMYILACLCDTKLRSMKDVVEEFTRIYIHYREYLIEEILKGCDNATVDSNPDCRNFVLFYNAVIEASKRTDSQSSDIVNEMMQPLLDLLSWNGITEKELSGILKFCSNYLVKDISVSKEIQNEFAKAWQEHAKDPVVVVSRDVREVLPHSMDARDQNMAQQLYRFAKPGMEIRAFLGYKHIPGVVKHLFQLHEKEKSTNS